MSAQEPDNETSPSRPPAALQESRKDVPSCSPPPYTSEWSSYVVLLLSCLSVAACGLGGNAVRFVWESYFPQRTFFVSDDYIMPNAWGSFLMGLFVSCLPPESYTPLLYRGLCVGFCGSLTTFSTWIVRVMVQNTSSAAFERLFIGGVIPIVFFLWGRDLARMLIWLYVHYSRCPYAPWTAHCHLLRALDLTFFVLAMIAAVLAPVLMQVYINRDRVRVISTDDIRMVVLAPAGALVRFLLSVFLNKRECFHQFPVGTLIANLGAVVLAIIMYNLQVLHPSNVWFVMAAQGISGSLSTVSSLVNELFGFYGKDRVRFAYLYALVTVGVSLFIAGIGRPQVYRRKVG